MSITSLLLARAKLETTINKKRKETTPELLNKLEYRN